MMKKLFIFSIAVVLFLASFVVPDISPAQKTALGIFMVALVLWVSEVIPLYLTSILILFLECVLLTPVSGIGYRKFISAFFSPILLLFLGGFTIAAGMKKFGIEEIIAQQMLKKIGKKPYSVLLGFMLVTAFLSMWMSNTAATALMITVALPLMQKIGRFKKALILGIPFAASIGGMATPIGTPPNAIAMDFIKRTGKGITFAEWMLRTIPFTLLLLVISSLVLYFIFSPGVKTLPLELKNEQKLKGKGTIVLSIVSITIILWLLSPLHKISSSVIALIPIILLFGGGFLRRDDFRNLEWDILVLMGGGLALGKAISSTGLGEWLVKSSGISELSGYLIMGAFIIITALISNFMSNTSTTALVMPLAVSALNVHFMPLAIALSASSALVLPISTPPNAIAYGSGYLKIKDMTITGSIVNTIAVILIYFSALTWWRLF